MFLSELIGSAVLIMVGCGVGANVSLARTKGHGGGPLMVSLGWGLAVYAAVYVAFASGAHLNPAVTLGLLAARRNFFDGNAELGLEVVPSSGLLALVYVLAQLLGAMIGAVLAWLAYKKHFDAYADAEAKRGVFVTSPAIRSYGWNVLTEVLATFVLVFIVVLFGNSPSGLGPLAVALIVVVIGLGLGGPTGYAINPTRDLGPRIVYSLLPIPGKGTSDWSYAWVPVVGPLIGGVLGGIGAVWLQGAVGL